MTRSIDVPAKRNTNARTPHSRALRAATASAWNQDQQAHGWRRVTVMIPPAESEMLDRQVEREGTLKAAIAAAIRAADAASL